MEETITRRREEDGGNYKDEKGRRLRKKKLA